MEGRRLCPLAPRSNDVSSEQTTGTTPQQELAQTRARADLLMALYAHVAHDLGRVTGERDGLRAERDQARRELDQARSELDQARREASSEVQRLNNALGQREARIAELQQHHAALLDSRSWRVTAPLRMLGDLFKRVF
jgi:hypothetical protein